MRYERFVQELTAALRAEESFDMIHRRLQVSDRQAALFFIDGFVKDDVMERILEYFMTLTPEGTAGMSSAKAFVERFATYVEVEVTDTQATVVTGVLSGMLALVVEGLDGVILIDARTYPARSVQEPEADRVLRGSHDGFVETLIFNTALIRRRIRDPALTMDILQIGSTSKTDVVLCYMANRADKKLLAHIRGKLQAIDIPSLTMGQESLVECLIKKQWYNPFPKVRYTERPDCAAASVAEGSILILTDTSSSVMIVPTSIFDFIQDTNDYCFPPIVGTYLRLVRGGVFLATLFLTPVWYLLISNPQVLPDWLSFIQIDKHNSIPLLIQLLLIEGMIDAVKLASLNTPGVLNNAFGVVGALLLGEFAVSTGWFVPEVLLYMAVVAVGNFTQPSFELGYAFKLFRMLFLVLIALWNVWGFAGGLCLMLLTLVTTRTVSGGGYLYPLIPFHGKALLRLLYRRALSRDNSA